MQTQRPHTLLEVSQWVNRQQKEFHEAVKEFIDDFIFHPNREHFMDEPEPMADQVQHVYLAGLAEYLAFWLDEPKPLWVEKPDRFLKESVHFGGDHSTVYVQMETPFSFRRRLLFCGDTLQKLKVMLAKKQ